MTRASTTAALLALGVLASRDAGAQARRPSRAQLDALRARCGLAVAPDWNHWALAGATLAVGAGWTVVGFADPPRYDTARVGLMQGLGIGTTVSAVLLGIRLGAPDPVDATSACVRLRAVRPGASGEARAALRVARQLRWLGAFGRGWARGSLITASALTVVGAGLALATALGAAPAARFANATGVALGLSLGFWLAPLVPAPGVRAAVVPVAGGGAVAVVGGGF